VLARFVTIERARDVYGVVFRDESLTDALELDLEATARRRAELRQ
jgi:hypothetical protein